MEEVVKETDKKNSHFNFGPLDSKGPIYRNFGLPHLRVVGTIVRKVGTLPDLLPRSQSVRGCRSLTVGDLGTRLQVALSSQ